MTAYKFCKATQKSDSGGIPHARMPLYFCAGSPAICKKFCTKPKETFAFCFEICYTIKAVANSLR